MPNMKNQKGADLQNDASILAPKQAAKAMAVTMHNGNNRQVPKHLQRRLHGICQDFTAAALSTCNSRLTPFPFRTFFPPRPF